MAYMLRVRESDSAEWSEPEAFTSKRQWETASAMARIISRLRTHSWKESRSEERARLAREREA